MQSLEDLQKELTRLQMANQKYGFLLNAMQYVKIRQTGAADLQYQILEKKIIATLDSLISENTQFADVPKPTTGATTPTPLKVL